MAKHILFFSRRCQHCESVMRTITNQENAMSKFVFIEIEKVQRSLIPSCVRSIPTMLVHSNPEQVLAGAAAIISFFNKGNSQGQRNQQHQQYPQHTQQQQQDSCPSDGLLPSAGDLQGYSANYSFLDNAEKTLDSGNFSYLDGHNNGVQMSAPMGGGGGGGGMGRGSGGGAGGRFTQETGRIDKAALLDSQYEKMMANRDVGIPGPIKRQ